MQIPKAFNQQGLVEKLKSYESFNTANFIEHLYL